MDIKNRFSEKLKNKRPVFFLLGALITQSLIFAAFSVKTVRQTIPVLESYISSYGFDDFEPREIYREPPPPSKQNISFRIDPESRKVNILQEVRLEQIENVETEIDFLSSLNRSLTIHREEAITEIIEPISFDPEFPGGEKAMYQFIKDNFVYPEYAKRIELEGMIMMVFVVDKDGYIKDVNVDSKTRSLGYGLEEEAIRVLSIMPKWKPGFVFNKSVDRVFKIPFHITLDMSN